MTTTNNLRANLQNDGKSFGNDYNNVLSLNKDIYWAVVYTSSFVKVYKDSVLLTSSYVYTDYSTFN